MKSVHWLWKSNNYFLCTAIQFSSFSTSSYLLDIVTVEKCCHKTLAEQSFPGFFFMDM